MRNWDSMRGCAFTLCNPHKTTSNKQLIIFITILPDLTIAQFSIIITINVENDIARSNE